MGLILSDEAIRKCGEIFGRHPKYAIADTAINQMVRLLPGNTDQGNVIAKVAVIKTLYATPIFDVWHLSQHICTIDGLDSLLAKGDLIAVDRIRKGHKIFTKKNQTELDFYSFATKYCSFHNPAVYPIYDNSVAGFIVQTHLQTGMAQSRSRLNLHDYQCYKAAIDAVTSRFGITIRDYKELDRGLWIISKYFNFRSTEATEDEWWLVKEIGREFGIAVPSGAKV